MTTLQIESASIEPLDVTIKSVGDPTSSLPSFQVTSLEITTPVASWVNGTWDGTWDATTKRVGAVTPTIGATGAGIEVAEGNYSLWIKWGTVVKLVGRLRVS